MKPLPIICALAMSACGTLQGSQYAVYEFDMPYDALAACVYGQINGDEPMGLRYVDLKAIGAAEITFTQGAVEAWSARFTKAAEGRSTLTVRALPTIRGADFHAQSIRAYAQNCRR